MEDSKSKPSACRRKLPLGQELGGRIALTSRQQVPAPPGEGARGPRAAPGSEAFTPPTPPSAPPRSSPQGSPPGRQNQVSDKAEA